MNHFEENKKKPLLFLLFAIFITGCGPTYNNGSTNPACVNSPMQHTGAMTVLNINVGYCEKDGKSGTSVCDRTITYKTDLGQIRQLGLVRSGTWPLVWKGAHGDIWFWISKDVIDCKNAGAIVTEFDEIAVNK